MNKTVELVNHWGAFEERHPEGSIAGFCRHFLAQERQREDGSPSSPVPPDIEGLMLRTIGRIGKMAMALGADALSGTGVKTLEEAGLLLYIDMTKNPKKSEAIYNNLLELSSGVDMLNRLVRRGLLTEFADREDRRSKRMKLTARGEETVAECKIQLMKMARMLTLDMTPDEVLFCFKLIQGIDTKFTPAVLNLKNKPFHELYADLAGEE